MKGMGRYPIEVGSNTAILTTPNAGGSRDRLPVRSPRPTRARSPDSADPASHPDVPVCATTTPFATIAQPNALRKADRRGAPWRRRQIFLFWTAHRRHLHAPIEAPPAHAIVGRRPGV